MRDSTADDPASSLFIELVAQEDLEANTLLNSVLVYDLESNKQIVQHVFRYKTLPHFVVDEVHLAVAQSYKTFILSNNSEHIFGPSGDDLRRRAKLLFRLGIVKTDVVAGIALTKTSGLSVVAQSEYDNLDRSSTVYRQWSSAYDDAADGIMVFDEVKSKTRINVKLSLKNLLDGLRMCGQLQSAKDKIVDMWLSIGWRNVNIMTCFALLAVLRDDHYVISYVLKVEGIAAIGDDKLVVTALKEIHSRVRSMSAWRGWLLNRDERFCLQYLMENMSRKDWKLDFSDEIQERMENIKPKCILSGIQSNFEFERTSFHQYCIQFGTALKACGEIMFRDLKPDNVLTLDQFIAKGYEWAASGSAPGVKIIYPGQNKDFKTAATKRAWIEQASGNSIKAWMDATPPHIKSTLVPKKENGKDRALTNTVNEEYALEAYMLQGLEDTVPSLTGCLMKEGGAKEVENVASRFKALEERYGWSYDYESFENNHDFNVMEQLWQMTTTMRVKQALLAGNFEAARDYERVGGWISKAVSNVYLRDMTTGESGWTKFGLMTGTRGTAYVNTVLNKVYSMLLQRSLTNMGCMINSTSWGHMGDDVLAVVADYTDASIMTSIMGAMGYRTNVSKTLIEYETGELLRRWYDQKKDLKTHLNRTIPNIVTGEWDLAASSLPYDKVISMVELIRLLNARGSSVEYNLALLQSVRIGQGAVTFQGRKQLVPITYLFTPTHNGGAGCHWIQGVQVNPNSRWRVEKLRLLPEQFKHVWTDLPSNTSNTYRRDLVQLGIQPNTQAALKLMESEMENAYAKTFPKKWLDDMFDEIGNTNMYTWLGPARAFDHSLLKVIVVEMFDTISQELRSSLKERFRLGKSVDKLTKALLKLKPNRIEALRIATGYADNLDALTCWSRVDEICNHQSRPVVGQDCIVLSQYLGEKVVNAILHGDFVHDPATPKVGEAREITTLGLLSNQLMVKLGPYASVHDAIYTVNHINRMLTKLNIDVLLQLQE